MPKVFRDSDAVESVMFRHRYSPRLVVGIEFSGQGRTKQSFKDECDINRIMQRYAATGMIDALNPREARYADVSEMDYVAAQQQIAAAQSMFYDLPSAVRSRFGNDPRALLAFLDDSRNLDEAIALGLAVKRDEVPADKVGAGAEVPLSAPGGAAVAAKAA